MESIYPLEQVSLYILIKKVKIMPINVTIWNEGRHEQKLENVKKVYPNGIHNAIADGLSVNEDFIIRTATLDAPNCGLTDDILESTDVLLWWGHSAHNEVPDELAEKIHQAVLKGMGFIALHSSHYSKPFIKLMGTSCTLKWRDGDRERLWVVSPMHPIAQGLPEYIELPKEEMYGERFDIPTPDDIVFIGWFSGGEVFRSGCTFTRGYGKVFYFQPGHEEYPIYYDENIKRILTNAIRWAAPIIKREIIQSPFFKSLENKE
jgi:trehalose utilization protein